MYYKLNESGKIAITSDQPEKDFLFTEEEIVSSYDGQRLLFKHETETPEYIEAEKKYKAQQGLTNLRYRRERECFPIINRGELWYGRLTDKQRAELDAWYKAWLDVTQTLIIPDKPAWLEKL